MEEEDEQEEASYAREYTHYFVYSEDKKMKNENMS